MQDDKKTNGIVRFLRDKGYYLVLLLCAAAVGVSGYLLLSGRDKTPAQEVKASESGVHEQVDASQPRTADVMATQPSGKTEPTEPSQASKSDLKVVAPVDGEPVNSFAADFLAYNTTTRDWRTHEGVDLAAAAGAPVKAAADGTVYTIYDDDSLGTTVVLRHENGYTTHYSNLAEEVSVKVGDKVKAGDELGKVGTTANIETASEPHLHFAVYRNNSPIDPTEFLKTS